MFENYWRVLEYPFPNSGFLEEGFFLNALVAPTHLYDYPGVT